MNFMLSWSIPFSSTNSFRSRFVSIKAVGKLFCTLTLHLPQFLFSSPGLRSNSLSIRTSITVYDYLYKKLIFRLVLQFPLDMRLAFLYRRSHQLANAYVSVCACECRMLEINSSPVQIIRNITHFLRLMNSLLRVASSAFCRHHRIPLCFDFNAHTFMKVSAQNALLGNDIGDRLFNRFVREFLARENKFSTH